jgi:hypothetical protein
VFEAPRFERIQPFRVAWPQARYHSSLTHAPLAKHAIDGASVKPIDYLGNHGPRFNFAEDWIMGRKLLLGLLLLAPLSFYPFLRDTGAENGRAKYIPQPPPPLTPDQHLVLGCFALLPGQSFPAVIPWEPYRKIGQQESHALELLAETDPVEFLQLCLNRYEQDVRGYRCVFAKQEKVNGKLRKKERIFVHFREKPFSVHMEWLEGNDLLGAKRTLYAEGLTDGFLFARTTFGLVVPKKLDDPQVTATSRFPITQFGVASGARDTLKSMRAAKENGTLYISYEGIVRVKEVGDRLCYKFIRAPQVPPEAEGVNELILYVDLQTHMQVGSVLLDTEGNLIAEYYFRDMDLNPSFDEKQFTRSSL